MPLSTWHIEAVDVHRVPAVPKAVVGIVEEARGAGRIARHYDLCAGRGEAPIPTSKTMSGMPDASSIRNRQVLGVKALECLGVVLGRGAPHGECALWIVYDDDALGLHVDHRL